MTAVVKGRMTAEIEGDFVVFLIGMRINKPWKVHKWFPVAMAMPKMLRELAQDLDSGYLGSVQTLGVIVQYWRSFEHLEAYARAKDRAHWPAWVAFNKKVQAASGDVGIWHETYHVAAGQYETFYGSVPPYGLGTARGATLMPAAGRRETAKGRLRGETPTAP